MLRLVYCKTFVFWYHYYFSSPQRSLLLPPSLQIPSPLRYYQITPYGQ